MKEKNPIKNLFIPISSRMHYPILFTFLIFVFSTGFSPADAQNDTVQSDQQPNYPVIKPAGFMQQHFSVDDNEASPVSFSTHRARLGFTGDFSEKIKLSFIIGAVEPPDRTPALVNAFVDFNLHPMFKLRTGQFLVPFGVEGPEPIFLNPAIERSQAVREMNPYRMFRDIGMMASGEHSFFSYSLAILNGNGANVTETRDQKDVVFRVVFNAFRTFDVGFSGQIGNYDHDETLTDLNRNRWAAHAEYDQNAVFLRSELMTRNMETEPDGEEIHSRGGYFLGGYRLSGKWNVIGRVEYYQPDDEVSSDYQGLTLGTNYFVTERTRLSINGMAIAETGDSDDMQYGMTVQLQLRL